MPLPPEIIEYGIAGISAVVAIKSLDALTEMIKIKKNGKSPKPDPALAQSKENGFEIQGLKRSIQRVEKVLIDGNGQPGLVTSVALLSQQMEAHAMDENVHKK